MPWQLSNASGAKDGRYGQDGLIKKGSYDDNHQKPLTREIRNKTKMQGDF
jgi:hypothetical protein